MAGVSQERAQRPADQGRETVHATELPQQATLASLADKLHYVILRSCATAEPFSIER